MRNERRQAGVDLAANIAARRRALAAGYEDCPRFPPLFGKSLPFAGAYDAWHG